jgi:adenylosuccinate synthase
MKVKVVIGANYGDEGKGLMTDYLVRQEKNPLVIRFNGGAQAGHTVNDGKIRHVFSHFGSGTLAGAPTYLSEYFVVNPLLFVKEKKELIEQGYDWNKMRVWVDPYARVTTPYDMIINQALEDSRAGARHGSVGVGFGETIEQSERYEKALRVKDLYELDKAQLYKRLNQIQKEWFIPRLEELGLENHYSLPFYKQVNLKFIDSAREMLGAHLMTRKFQCANLHYNDLVENKHTLIFEGAQGLLLDEDGKDFPHVTRSKTGLNNVMELMSDIGKEPDEDPEVVYVSRVYMTRHGAGPLINGIYDPKELGIQVMDETNKHGDYQGSLRIAPLDLSEFYDRIDDDVRDNNWKGMISRAFTHVDAIDNAFVHIAYKGKAYMTNRDYLLNEILETGKYLSVGDHHNNVLRAYAVRKLKQIWG